MEIFLTFLITLFGFYLFRNNKQETSSRILEKNKQKQPTKHEKNRVKKTHYKYNPGQVRKNPELVQKASWIRLLGKLMWFVMSVDQKKKEKIAR